MAKTGVAGMLEHELKVVNEKILTTLLPNASIKRMRKSVLGPDVAVSSDVTGFIKYVYAPYVLGNLVKCAVLSTIARGARSMQEVDVQRGCEAVFNEARFQIARSIRRCAPGETTKKAKERKPEQCIHLPHTRFHRAFKHMSKMTHLKLIDTYKEDAFASALTAKAKLPKLTESRIKSFLTLLENRGTKRNQVITNLGTATTALQTAITTYREEVYGATGTSLKKRYEDYRASKKAGKAGTKDAAVLKTEKLILRQLYHDKYDTVLEAMINFQQVYDAKLRELNSAKTDKAGMSRPKLHVLRTVTSCPQVSLHAQMYLEASIMNLLSFMRSSSLTRLPVSKTVDIKKYQRPKSIRIQDAYSAFAQVTDMKYEYVVLHGLPHYASQVEGIKRPKANAREAEQVASAASSSDSPLTPAPAAKQLSAGMRSSSVTSPSLALNSSHVDTQSEEDWYSFVGRSE